MEPTNYIIYMLLFILIYCIFVNSVDICTLESKMHNINLGGLLLFVEPNINAILIDDLLTSSDFCNL